MKRNLTSKKSTDHSLHFNSIPKFDSLKFSIFFINGLRQKFDRKSPGAVLCHNTPRTGQKDAGFVGIRPY